MLQTAEFFYVKYFELPKYKKNPKIKSTAWVDINSAPF